MHKQIPLTVVTPESSHETYIQPGTSLLSSIQEIPGIVLDAPCGGSGTCGKCLVEVVSGSVTPMTDEELSLLPQGAAGKSLRLACQAYVLDEDGNSLVVKCDGQPGAYQAARNSRFSEPSSPRFSVRELLLPPPSLQDQRSDLDHLMEQSKAACHRIPVGDLDKLRTLRKQGHALCLFRDGLPAAVLSTGEVPLGCAVDIGTTTVALYLVDLATGKVLARKSEMNLQRTYGSDVISRIRHASDPRGRSALKRLITDQLDRMFCDCAAEASFAPAWIRNVVIAGNTVMLHLLTGTDPSGIAEAPFIPVFTRDMHFKSCELGWMSIPSAEVRLLPGISSYVGADITSGLLAASVCASDKPVLFIDLGTNGEIALWDGKRLFCCSTAAGPAFEGASLSHGIGGVPGAVDSLAQSDDPRGITHTTIGGVPAAGICGSGVIDAAALLLDLSLMEVTGRLAEVGTSRLMTAAGDERAFTAVPAENAHNNRAVLVTQSDIREVQLAKAAVAAGIRILLETAGVRLEQVHAVRLAGGFGSWINVTSAQRIGLLPEPYRGIASSCGNTAGMGAVQAMLDSSSEAALAELVSSAHYIELSSHPEFQQAYVEEMIFPQG